MCSGAYRWQCGHLYLRQNWRGCAGLVPQRQHGLCTKDGHSMLVRGGHKEVKALEGVLSSGHLQVYPDSYPHAQRYSLLHLGHFSPYSCFFFTSGTKGVGGGWWWRRNDWCGGSGIPHRDWI